MTREMALPLKASDPMLVRLGGNTTVPLKMDPTSLNAVEPIVCSDVSVLRSVMPVSNKLLRKALAPIDVTDDGSTSLPLTPATFSMLPGMTWMPSTNSTRSHGGVPLKAFCPTSGVLWNTMAVIWFRVTKAPVPMLVRFVGKVTAPVSKPALSLKASSPIVCSEPSVLRLVQPDSPLLPLSDR